MVRTFSFCLFGIFLFSLNTTVFAQENPDASSVEAPRVVDVIPNQIFVPPGFDDNDNVQVVVDGTLPNTCYKLTGPAQPKIDKEKKEVRIKQQAYFYSDCYCLDVVVHYTQTVNLGILPAGDYKIIVESGEEQKPLAELPVAQVATEKKTKGPDNFDYAPVRALHVDYSKEEGKSVVVLDITFNSACMDIDEVKASIQKGNIIEILPKMKVNHTHIRAKKCPHSQNHIQVKIPLHELTGGKPWEKGRYLVHVRSLDGQSHNLVADL